jgi:hypothetical protein
VKGTKEESKTSRDANFDDMRVRWRTLRENCLVWFEKNPERLEGIFNVKNSPGKPKKDEEEGQTPKNGETGDTAENGDNEDEAETEQPDPETEPENPEPAV